MISILSLVTSIKDYIEIVHKLIETDNSFGRWSGIQTFIPSYFDLGSIITYTLISFKELLTNFISFNWFWKIFPLTYDSVSTGYFGLSSNSQSNPFGWDLAIIIPDINSAMISEISVLDGYFHNTFNFLDKPISPTDIQHIPGDVLAGETNITIYSLEKFSIGLINSLFLCIPTGTTHLITLRRFVMQGIKAGYLAGLGTICGNILWISSIIFGFRFFVIPWLSLDIFRYVLGFICLIKYMWDSYNEKKIASFSIPDREKFVTEFGMFGHKLLPNTSTGMSPPSASQKKRGMSSGNPEATPEGVPDKNLVRNQKIFLLNFLLALTEQTSLYPFMTNISIGSESSLLESFPARNNFEFLSIHGSYILGLTIGCLTLLHFTCWFWQNPAFKFYMWLDLLTRMGKFITSPFFLFWRLFSYKISPSNLSSPLGEDFKDFPSAQGVKQQFNPAYPESPPNTPPLKFLSLPGNTSYRPKAINTFPGWTLGWVSGFLSGMSKDSLFPDTSKTPPQTFRHSGYATGSVGKTSKGLEGGTSTLYYKVLNFVFLYLTMICAISSIPYYGLDYTLTNPLGLVQEDRILDQKLILETSFLNTKASDRNTRRNRGRHGRRERWKRRIRKYRTFDASLYDQGIYDLFSIEDLNYGFDRFWLRRKMRNHRVRFRFFPGPWMRSFKKQLAKPRLESYAGPRQEFFRILFEQVYHPSFHEYLNSIPFDRLPGIRFTDISVQIHPGKSFKSFPGFTIPSGLSEGISSISSHKTTDLFPSKDPQNTLRSQIISLPNTLPEGVPATEGRNLKGGSTHDSRIRTKIEKRTEGDVLKYVNIIYEPTNIDRDPSDSAKESSTLRKFVRKINNRTKSLEIISKFSAIRPIFDNSPQTRQTIRLVPAFGMSSKTSPAKVWDAISGGEVSKQNKSPLTVLWESAGTGGIFMEGLNISSDNLRGIDNSTNRHNSPVYSKRWKEKFSKISHGFSLPYSPSQISPQHIGDIKHFSGKGFKCGMTEGDVSKCLVEDMPVPAGRLNNFKNFPGGLLDVSSNTSVFEQTLTRKVSKVSKSDGGRLSPPPRKCLPMHYINSGKEIL